MPIKVVVPISGGRDSQACMELALQNYPNEEVIGLFNDTKFEHPKTYKHVDYIAKAYGVTIHRTEGGSVEEQVLLRGRFPTALQRFCTSNLKLRPSKIFYHKLAVEQGIGFEVWLGVRKDESVRRDRRYAGKVGGEVYPPHEVMPSEYPQYLAKAGVMIRLPIIDWSAEDVLSFITKKINPLYAQGFDRVGCFPCLASGDIWKEKSFAHDSFGEQQWEKVQWLSAKIGKSVWQSKGGKKRAAERETSGCAFCQI